MENRPENCLCRSKTGLFITKRQASMGLSALLVSVLLIFLAGYFWGRRQPVSDLTTQLSSAILAETAEVAKLTDLTQNTDPNLDLSSASEKQYYGALIGFSNLKAARKFLNKLQNMGYDLQIKTRHSRNSKNKLYTWYQIVTEKFTDKAKLEQLMQDLKQRENLPNTKLLEA